MHDSRHLAAIVRTFSGLWRLCRLWRLLLLDSAICQQNRSFYIPVLYTKSPYWTIVKMNFWQPPSPPRFHVHMVYGRPYTYSTTYVGVVGKKLLLHYWKYMGPFCEGSKAYWFPSSVNEVLAQLILRKEIFINKTIKVHIPHLFK